MKKTSLCYIQDDNYFLMLFRNKKNADPNEGKWIGIGGKFEKDETPDECMLREVYEETGIRLKDYHFHGVIEFRSEAFEDEDMYLYSASLPEGYTRETPVICNEGTPKWIPFSEIMSLNLWEGDRIFLKKMIEKHAKISMTLRYDKDGNLIN